MWKIRKARSVLIPGLLAALTVSACAMTPERLPNLSRRFYYNLETDADQQQFLNLKESEREAYLKQKGLWQQWTALTAEQRNAALQGDIQVGFPAFAAFMAWGAPADSQGTSPGYHTFIRCTSGPKRGRYVKSNLDCDGTSSETKLTIVEDRVSEIKHLN